MLTQEVGEREEIVSMQDGRGGPLFLVGPARSGTSLLYKALCMHPEASYVSNWVARLPALPRLSILNRLARRFPGARRKAWFAEDSNAYVYGSRRSLALRLFPMPVEGEPIYAACGVSSLEDPTSQGTPAQKERLRRTFEAIRKGSGGAVVVNKRIANNRRIPFLASAFPGARFVAIVRDGRGVALSLSKVDWWGRSVLPWYGGTPQMWASEGRDPWEACARNWVEDVRAMDDGLRCLPRDRVLRLTYEAFVDSPLDTLTGIARFAQMSASPEWERSLGALTFPNRNEAWRSELSSSALATITTIQKPVLEEYGYDL